jgi:hypothetical protein
MRQPRKPTDCIIWVALADSPEEWERRGRIAAQRLRPRQIRRLRRYYHKPPEKPVEALDRFNGLGDWLEVCQQAIFEIFYHRHEVSLPIIRRAVFAGYDWTQVWALLTLGRLAAQGIEREKCVDDIVEVLPTLRYEAFLPAVRAVAWANYKTEAVVQTLEQAIHDSKENDPVDALSVLEIIQFSFPEMVEAHRTFLEGLMDGKGLENRHPMLDGAIWDPTTGEAHWRGGSPPPDQIHQIRAAAVLYSINPEEENVAARLKNWQSNHPDKNMRDSISNIIKLGK